MFAIISDLHIGVHRSDPKYLKWALDYCDFLVDTLKGRKVNELFILGDVFHNRKEVSTIAIETARKFFDKLSSANIGVEIIPGNHDCYYDSRSDVTSLALLSGWDNIHVHYSPVEINHMGGKIGVMVPWGCALDDLKSMNGGRKFDWMMGHFEITSFNMTGGAICESGVSSDEVLKVSPMVFSGHFHLITDRSYGNRGRIVYVGSPYELDWGDYGSKKGIWFYEEETGSLEFVENTVSPRHVKIEVSQNTLNDKDMLNKFKSDLGNVSGNIVRVVSDDLGSESRESVQKIVEIVNRLNPGEFTCDLKVLDNGDKADSVEISNNLDPRDALSSYIDATCGEFAQEVKKIVMEMYSNVSKE